MAEDIVPLNADR